MKIIHLELDTALEAIDRHLRWTNTKTAYLNKSNLQFILEATKTKFNSDKKPLQKKASFMLTQIVKSHPLAAATSELCYIDRYFCRY